MVRIEGFASVKCRLITFANPHRDNEVHANVIASLARLTEAVHNPAKAVVLAEMFIPPSGEIWNSATCSTYVNCTVKQLFAFRGTLLRFTPRLRYTRFLNNPFFHPPS